MTKYELLEKLAPYTDDIKIVLLNGDIDRIEYAMDNTGVGYLIIIIPESVDIPSDYGERDKL